MRTKIKGSLLAFRLIVLAALVVTGAAAKTSERTSTEIPVRVSRALFERQLDGSVNGTSSPIRWNEYAEALPPPLTDPGKIPLMINDDHIGCAEFQNLTPLRLCFKIQADVSSVALNSDQMWLEGLEAIPRIGDLSCMEALHLIEKRKMDSGFSVKYEIIPKNTAVCSSAGGTIRVSVTSREQSEARSASSRYSR